MSAAKSKRRSARKPDAERMWSAMLAALPLVPAGTPPLGAAHLAREYAVALMSESGFAENLHRSELTALERDQHVAEWIRPTEKAEQLAQVEPKAKVGHRPQDDAHRAVKVASLTDEAKETAREVGLNDNRSALLAAANPPPRLPPHDSRSKDVGEVLRSIRESQEALRQEIDWSSAPLGKFTSKRRSAFALTLVARQAGGKSSET